ncbi:hypothetical protein HK103_007405 [Boothiomyces macroporosus]|uniref:ADP/ATP translocase n=1 Tax=Boothiomyces macroporosus TaxID=261099 RepID=A0AAD5Y639_9FUNG|nr:hypothetical protein HK103_007405 [Boothiomyces macroporosus]
MSEKQKDTFLVALGKDFLAGGVSGVISKTATSPIERVKLLIQTQDANPKIISGEVPRYTGFISSFGRVYREQGLAAFWRGNVANCIRYFPTQAINLASKDSIKGALPKYNPNTDFWKFFAINLTSGGLAGALSLTVIYPLDYARTRLAADVGTGKRQFSGLWDCLVKTSRGPKGFLSIYQGYGVGLAGIVGYRGVQFGLNDTIKGLNPYDKETSFRGILSKWITAQVSVIASSYPVYPLDTIRRRLQMQSEKPINERIYNGTFDCFKKIVKNEGVTALFKGAGANVFRSVGAALVLVLYGEVQAIIKQ